LAGHAAAAEPDNAVFAITLSLAHYRAADYDAAYQVLQGIAASDEQSAARYFLLAMTCHQLGRPDAANRAYHYSPRIRKNNASGAKGAKGANACDSCVSIRVYRNDRTPIREIVASSPAEPKRNGCSDCERRLFDHDGIY
jgi:hypothetical protein